MKFSVVIPVYNRPNEIDELLRSFSRLEGDKDFEIVSKKKPDKRILKVLLLSVYVSVFNDSIILIIVVLSDSVLN